MNPPPSTRACGSGEVVEDAGLARRDAAFRLGERDLAVGEQHAPAPAAGSSARAPRSASPSSRQIREPPSPSQLKSRKLDASRGQSLRAGRRSPAPSRRVERDDIERLGRRDAEPAPLADRVMNDAGVAAEHAPVDMDDVAGPRQRRAAAARSSRCNGPPERSRCPGCRPSPRSSEAELGAPARAPAPLAARRAESAARSSCSRVVANRK